MRNLVPLVKGPLRVVPPPTPRQRQVHITELLIDRGFIIEPDDRVLILGTGDIRGEDIGSLGAILRGSARPVAEADLVVVDCGDHAKIVKYRGGRAGTAVPL